MTAFFRFSDLINSITPLLYEIFYLLRDDLSAGKCRHIKKSFKILFLIYKLNRIVHLTINPSAFSDCPADNIESVLIL